MGAGGLRQADNVHALAACARNEAVAALDGFHFPQLGRRFRGAPLVHPCAALHTALDDVGDFTGLLVHEAARAVDSRGNLPRLYVRIGRHIRHEQGSVFSACIFYAQRQSVLHGEDFIILRFRGKLLGFILLNCHNANAPFVLLLSLFAKILHPFVHSLFAGKGISIKDSARIYYSIPRSKVNGT